MGRRARHLISIQDLSWSEIREIVSRGVELAGGRLDDAARPLAGRVVGTLFTKTSTRTRTAFSAGALRLGAGLVAYGPDDLQVNTGESIDDTGRVLAGMLDVVVVRTAGDPLVLRQWAAWGGMSVVNAMTADEHPTQALADLTTLARHFGRLEGIRLLYVGEGNNTAVALSLALSRVPGAELHLHTPPGYGLPLHVHDQIVTGALGSGAVVTESREPPGAPAGFDVIYTTRWQTTGTSKADPRWREVFAPFQVTTALWDRSPDAVFMHDLPAHRGEDVLSEVLDGPRSIAFTQAENKMHSAMAVLEWCADGR